MKNRINFINQVDEFGYMKRETTTTEETDHDADIQQEIKETSFSCVQYSDRYVGPCSSTDNRNQSDLTQEIEAGQSVSTRNLAIFFNLYRGHCPLDGWHLNLLRITFYQLNLTFGPMEFSSGKYFPLAKSHIQVNFYYTQKLRTFNKT